MCWIDSQRLENGVQVNAIDCRDCDTLELRMFTRDDGDIPIGNTECFREQSNQFVVCGAFNRRGLQTYEQRAIARSSDTGFARARDDPDGEITPGVALNAVRHPLF